MAILILENSDAPPAMYIKLIQKYDAGQFLALVIAIDGEFHYHLQGAYGPLISQMTTSYTYPHIEKVVINGILTKRMTP